MDEELESLDSENTIYQMPAAGPLSDTDLLYLLQGLGTDRDRKLTLAVLLSWIAGKIQQGGSLASILLSKDKTTYKNILNLDGDGIELENAQNESHTTLAETLRVLLKTNYLNIIKTANNERREIVVDADGIRFRHGSGSDNEKASILIDIATDEIQFSVPNGINFLGKTSSKRLNLVTEDSVFSVDSDADINTLLESSNMGVKVGDVVIVRNTSAADVTIDFGNYDSILKYKMTLNAYCAMSFICVRTQGMTNWAPLGNATVVIES